MSTSCSAWRATSAWRQRSNSELVAGRREEPPDRQAGPVVSRTSRWSTLRQLEPRAAAWSARPRSLAVKPIPVSSSPRSSAAESGRQYLYEKLYCARGEMENRIKECQLDLFADRTSAATMRANQLRLWFASIGLCAAVCFAAHRTAYTQFAEATCGTIRFKLLKLGALVRVSVRRIKIAMASACPAACGLGLRGRSSRRRQRSRLARLTRAAAARNNCGIIPGPPRPFNAAPRSPAKSQAPLASSRTQLPSTSPKKRTMPSHHAPPSCKDSVRYPG